MQLFSEVILIQLSPFQFYSGQCLISRVWHIPLFTFAHVGLSDQMVGGWTWLSVIAPGSDTMLKRRVMEARPHVFSQTRGSVVIGSVSVSLSRFPTDLAAFCMPVCLSITRFPNIGEFIHTRWGGVRTTFDIKPKIINRFFLCALVVVSGFSKQQQNGRLYELADPHQTASLIYFRKNCLFYMANPACVTVGIS